MLELILQILRADDFFGESEAIDFAKGSKKIPTGIREGMKQHKRKKAWLKQ